MAVAVIGPIPLIEALDSLISDMEKY